MIFYTKKEQGERDPAHVGIQDGEFIIDTNCEIHGPPEETFFVKKHNQQALEDAYPRESRKKAPKELKELDGE